MRTAYLNGNLIKSGTVCDGCNSVLSIGNTLVHERECPEAWQDRKHHCMTCGAPYYLKEKAFKRESLHCPKCLKDAEYMGKDGIK